MQAPLFPSLENEEQLPLFSDLGEDVFIPTPEREYPPVHFMEIARVGRLTTTPTFSACIANLSSDEVFTPPQLVNRILDMLPANLWSDKKVTFLDPGCKSGVFLREIVKRLDNGLEKQIPNRQKRLNHIFKNQVFGLAITELTALLSRRSVYCSKTANGKYSVCEAFDNPEGNIRFGRVEHTWENGRCVYLRRQQGELRTGRRTGKSRLRRSFIPTSRRRYST